MVKMQEINSTGKFRSVGARVRKDSKHIILVFIDFQMMKAMCKRLVNDQEGMPMVFMPRNRFGSYNVQLYIRKDSTLIKHFIEEWHFVS